jgi:hypothetical protein
MSINSHSRIPALDVAVKAQCSYVVKVLCLQRRFTARPIEDPLLERSSLIPSENTSSYCELQ